MLKTILEVVLLSVALAPIDTLGAPEAPAAAAPQGARATAPGDWRSARWGMSVEEVLAAFPGEAFRIDPPLKLADGNVVAVGIDGHEVGAHAFRVRFVFEAGKLAIVSLRTPSDVRAGPDVYASLQALLAERLGGAGESTANDDFIDMRQTRWKAGRSTVDLNYVPGTVVILYHPS
jgi:hypothetical protein